jgi:leucyl-tRNA synthetase
MEGKAERKSNAKVSALREIEVDVQKIWKEEKVFEVDAPEVINSSTHSVCIITNNMK